MENMDFKKRGLTYPRGFKVSSLNCGIKKRKEDLALLVSEDLSKCISEFTQNLFKSHSILLSKRNLSKSENNISGVIVNSGNANCLNGKEGRNDTLKIIQKLADNLEIDEDNILPASTGIIGKRLPLKDILKNIPELVKKLGKGKEKDRKFADAITTTDTEIKMEAVEIELENNKVRIAGVAKGSGMVKPNLATMLAFFTTDVNINKRMLSKAFRESIHNSFSNINIDGQSSTNDMCAIIASGNANNKLIDSKSKNFDIFKNILLKLCQKLAYNIVEDAEGAEKIIKVTVRNASSNGNARKIANSVAESCLVKTFIYGERTNWGRIVQAIGNNKVKLKNSNVEIKVNDNIVFQNEIIKSKEDKKMLKDNEIHIDINLNEKKGYAEVLSCDLTPEYVHINSVY